MSVSPLSQQPLSPVLRWAGSKKRSLPQLTPQLPPSFNRYVEAFAGSACLFFYLRPNSAVICDNNIELIRFYQTLADYPTQVFDIFMSIPRTREKYYDVRSRSLLNGDDITRSANFLYLNRNCFNGIFRTNAKGEFNVPFSDRRVPRYPTSEEIVAAAAALASCELHCNDFETVCIEKVREGDLVYLDPPYYVPSVRVFREYSPSPFSERDLVRLSAALEEIDRRGAHFLLSYPDYPVIQDLAQRWAYSRINVRRTVGGNTGSRGYVPELLIRNYEARTPESRV